jgi:hypothetical protein
MPLWVAISASPLKDGETCPRFDPVAWWKPYDLLGDPPWWKPYDLLGDPPFRVIDASGLD